MGASLLAIVESLQGHDIHLMTEVEGQAFKTSVMKQFRAASATFPALLLSTADDTTGYVWDAVPAEHYCCEWIGSFKLMPTRQLEAALGQPRLVRMAAVLMPDVEMMVELMGEYHCPGGLQSTPNLQIVVRVGSMPALSALEQLDDELCDGLVATASKYGFKLLVRTCDDCFPDQVAPKNLLSAIRAVASAVRIEDEECGGTGCIEGVEIRVSVPASASPPPEVLTRTLQRMGVFFVLCEG